MARPDEDGKAMYPEGMEDDLRNGCGKLKPEDEAASEVRVSLNQAGPKFRWAAAVSLMMMSTK